MEAKEDRIVIRRARKCHAPFHGGSWKIAYADFMTSMMSFFLIMWLLMLVPKKDLVGIAQYFRTPLMSAIQGSISDANPRKVIPGGSPTPIPEHTRADAPPMPVAQSSFAAANGHDNQRLEDLKRKLEALINADPILKKYKPQLVLDMTPEGLRIQILDAQDKPMFALGSADLSATMVEILHALAPTLNGMPNGLSIAGHTDAHPYSSGIAHYSNWELSADRANAARQALVAGGIDDGRIRDVVGLASTMNLVQSDPMAPANRRISIIVLNHKAEAALRETYEGPKIFLSTPAGAPQASTRQQSTPPTTETAPGAATPADRGGAPDRRTGATHER
ncbi:MAG: motility protein MotB [Candidimonas sp.]|nr:MAG: motility protein MotB [Candidimonas sp.]